MKSGYSQSGHRDGKIQQIKCSPCLFPHPRAGGITKLSLSISCRILKGNWFRCFEKCDYVNQKRMLKGSYSLSHHDKCLSLASMISSILAKTLSIRSNVKRADCRTCRSDMKTLLSVSTVLKHQCGLMHKIIYLNLHFWCHVGQLLVVNSYCAY